MFEIFEMIVIIVVIIKGAKTIIKVKKYNNGQIKNKSKFASIVTFYKDNDISLLSALSKKNVKSSILGDTNNLEGKSINEKDTEEKSTNRSYARSCLFPYTRKSREFFLEHEQSIKGQMKEVEKREYQEEVMEMREEDFDDENMILGAFDERVRQMIREDFETEDVEVIVDGPTKILSRSEEERTQHISEMIKKDFEEE